MYRSHDSIQSAGPVPACIVQPARLHAQVRATRRTVDNPFGFEFSDSAMPTRVHIA